MFDAPCYLVCNRIDFASLYTLQNKGVLYAYILAICQNKTFYFAYFLNNRGNIKVVVTTKTKTSVWKDDDYNIFFIPSSIYAYWVSDYLYKNRKAELLQIAPDAK